MAGNFTSFPLAGYPPPSLVQSPVSASAASGTTTLAYASNVTKGNCLMLGVAYEAASGVPAISDTLGNSWNQAGAISSTLSGTTLNLALFWTIAGASGANTITATFGFSVTGVWLIAAEFTNTLALAVLGASGNAVGNLGWGTNSAGGYSGARLTTSQPPSSTATGALLIMLAATSGQDTTYQLDPAGEPNYVIANQAGGICMAYRTQLYVNAPYCALTPPLPSLQRTSSDQSLQWVVLTAPFQPNGEPNPYGAAPPGLIQLQPIEQYPLPVYQPTNTPSLAG